MPESPTLDVGDPGTVTVAPPPSATATLAKSPAMRKTFKREYAAILMALLVAIVIKVFWFLPASEVAIYENLVMGLAWPFLSFVAAAAGLEIAQMVKR